MDKGKFYFTLIVIYLETKCGMEDVGKVGKNELERVLAGSEFQDGLSLHKAEMLVIVTGSK